jgi:hypothetical protein
LEETKGGKLPAEALSCRGKDLGKNSRFIIAY